MDFFQFLQKSSNSPVENTTNKNPNKKNVIKTQENQQLKNQQLKNQQLENQQLDNQETTVYKNIKRGDFVKIIYLKNSNLNIYKGYVGDIREYRKDQDSAIIFLHAISSSNKIRFPIEHFIKID